MKKEPVTWLIIFEKTSSLLNSNIVVAKQNSSEIVECIKKNISDNSANKYFFNENYNFVLKENNFFYLKGVIEKIFTILKIENTKYEVSEDELYDYKLNILKGKLKIGSIGEINSNYANDFSLDQKINICTLNLDLLKPSSQKVKYQEISKFPSSRRDLSMILDENVSFDLVY